MTRILFHLGDRKTGSTSIQSVLAAGAWHCPTVKLQYPVGDGANHRPLASSMLEAGAKPQRQLRFDNIRRQIDAQQPDIALISAEMFESANPEVLRDCIHQYLPDYAETARFVSYVRPHVDRTISSYAERIKQGLFHGTLADLHAKSMQSKRFIYTPRFLKWRHTFGDAFILRPFVRDRLINRDVVHDLLTVVFGTAPFEVKDMPKRNESLSLEDLALIQALQISLSANSTEKAANKKGSTLQTAIGWNLAARLSEVSQVSPTKLQADRALVLKMRDDYMADAKALDAAFFDGTPMTDELTAAPERSVATAQSLDLDTYFTPAGARVVSVFTSIISDLMRANPVILERFFQNKNRENMTGKTKPAKPTREKGRKKAAEASRGAAKAGPKGAANARKKPQGKPARRLPE